MRALATAAAVAVLVATPTAALSATTRSTNRTASSSASTTASPFADCAAPGSRIRVGVVACQREHAADLGGTTAFSYYVPAGCAPRLHRRCPTVYLLHGFGGDYTSMLGTAAHPSAWVAGLHRQPRVAPQRSAQPWTEADPSHWVHARPLDVVLVAPDGRTVPGGYGPAPLLESFWTDWNPRYARGGGDQRYATPAPRFASYLLHELIPDVQRHFPVGSGRARRAIVGTSLGGYGSYAIGLSHPDMFASIGAVSGIMNILLVHGLDPTPGSAAPVAGQPPTQLPTLTVPAPAGGTVPLPLLPSQAQGFAAATYAFGDPAADGAYYRARMPVDLALNAVATAGARQSLTIRGFSNDTVARRAADFTAFPDYEVAQGFEDLVFVTNQELNHSFAALGVRQHYELHPGIHEDVYWNPWLRQQLAAQYAALRHWDGGGSPAPSATRFDYRSAARAFSVWGWRVRVRRPVTEFLELDRVSCNGLTVRGSGRVTVTVPQRCHTGSNRSRIVHVDLGPSMPVDAPAGADAATAYGRTVHVVLHRLAER